MLALFKEHREELMHLVNHNREVMAAWNRYQGPAFLAHIARSVRRENQPIPDPAKRSEPSEPYSQNDCGLTEKRKPGT